MKRSNFTFLFLFALLSFAGTNAVAQSGGSGNGCIAELNVSVAADCSFTLTTLDFGSATAEADSIWIAPHDPDIPAAATGSGRAISGFEIPFAHRFEKGLHIYELYNADDEIVCWGEINIEHKALPPGDGDRDTVHCLEFDPDNIAFPAANIGGLLAGGCFAWPVEGSSPREIITSTETGCDTFMHIRTVVQDFEIDKRIFPATIRQDTVVVLPIDFGDICHPAAEIFVECDDVDLEGLDASDPADHPAIIAALSTGALLEAGLNDTLVAPYIKKENPVSLDSLSYCTEFVKRFTGEVATIEVLDKDGEIVHTVVPVVGCVCVAYDYIKGEDLCDDPVHPEAEEVADMDQPALDPALGITCDDYTCIPDACTEVEVEFKALPKGRSCNINVKCTPWVVEGDCEGLPVVMKEWEVLSFCDPKESVKDTVQWVNVVDTEAPVWEEDLEDVWVDVAPWTCAGEYHFTPDVSDWGWVDFNFQIDGGNVTINDDGTVYITNLQLEACPVAVYATPFDKCGNVGETMHFDIYVRDNIAPIAIAEDEVKVSLVASDIDFEGFGQVTVDAIDAGSNDAGCGKVVTCILRQEEFDNPILLSSGQTIPAGFTSNGGAIFDALGNQLYAPASCEHDGTIVITSPDGKAGSDTETLYYVICKDVVKFCCDDLAGASEASIPVTLVVRDDAGRDCSAAGHPASDNLSFSHSVVTIADKAGVVVICEDDTVLCGANGSLPQPTAVGLCGPVTLFPGDQDGSIDQCGEGAITVTWYFDEALTEFACRQTLVGQSSTAGFNPYTIKWPRHQNGDVVTGVRRECVDEDGEIDDDGVIAEFADGVAMGGIQECTGEPMGAPVFCDPICTLIGVNYSDDFDNSDSETCRKIIRRWTVIDWCTFEANTDTDDDDDDAFEAVDDTWLNSPVAANVAAGEDCEDCDKPSGVADDIYFRYTNVDEDGYYTFDQVISIRDNTPPVITVSAADTMMIVDGNGSKDAADFAGCVASGTITASASDLCLDMEADGDITWWIVREGVDPFSRSASGPTADMGTGSGMPGEEATITWMATDGCGNTATAVTVVTFEDNKSPTPVCIQFIATATMDESGESVIWASDFDFGSFDNCDPNPVVEFRDADGDATPSLRFTCADLPNGVSAPVSIDLYVVDATGNEDFCTVTLSIQDNDANACDDVDTGAAISGAISTELGDMIESARVTLNNALVDLTSVQGEYAFRSNPEFTDYTISSERNDDFLNGVTTLDLVLIQQHVLGISALNSPFKIIAADINSDERVTAIDLVELRKLILGVYTELPQNDSWRFVDATQTFADATRPFPFSESLDVANLVGDVTGQDFLGVKIGDVSGSAIANSLIAAGTRSAGTLSLEIADASVAAGEEVSVAVTAANFSDIAAYQFTMDVDGLEFTGVESGAIEVTEANFGLLDGNTITTAWNSTAGVNASDVLFTMNFRATAGVTLSKAIGISSRVTPATAYTSTAAQMGVNVSFSGVATSEFALFQNEPNPFDNVTRIGFELPNAASATLTVFDVTGKVVTLVRGDFAQGANTITLSKSDLNATGILYYQLESGEFTATQKMIVIE